MFRLTLTIYCGAQGPKLLVTYKFAVSFILNSHYFASLFAASNKLDVTRYVLLGVFVVPDSSAESVCDEKAWKSSKVEGESGSIEAPRH